VIELPHGESLPLYVVARTLGLDRKHLVHLVESGEIKTAYDCRNATASRSTIRIPRDAVLEFLERRKIVIVKPVKKQSPR
jgi:hypothetical protein